MMLHFGLSKFTQIGAPPDAAGFVELLVTPLEKRLKGYWMTTRLFAIRKVKNV